MADEAKPAKADAPKKPRVKDFRKIARKLGRMELMESSWEHEHEPFDLNANLFASEEARRGPRRFLDFYGDEGVRKALETYGLLDVLRGRGYDDFHVEILARDERHTLLLDGRYGNERPLHRLVELVVRKDRLDTGAVEEQERFFEVLTVDWLLMQDPKRDFPEARVPLPGQNFVGLGLSNAVLEMLLLILERLDLDALVTTGEHFHNAVIYRRDLSYFDPVTAGGAIALEDALLSREALTLAEASWAIEWGCVARDGEDKPLVWNGPIQLRARNDELIRLIKDPERRRKILAEAARYAFVFDRPRFEDKWREKFESAPCVSPSPA